MYQPADDTIILTCGPPDLMRKYLKKALPEIGHKEENIFDF